MPIKKMAARTFFVGIMLASITLSTLGLNKVFLSNGVGFIGVVYLYLGLALAFVLLLVWLTSVAKKSKV